MPQRRTFLAARPFRFREAFLLRKKVIKPKIGRSFVGVTVSVAPSR
jgi:hypothetical protein